VELLLVDELCEFIEAATKDYLVVNEKGSQVPRVVNGYLPPKREDGKDDDNEPVILVRLLDGQDEFQAGQGIATANTIIAVRTASRDVKIGPQNTLNLMNRIRRCIYASPILANRYRATFPVKWVAPEGTIPLWQGEMTIPWIVPMPQETWEVHEFADEK
jgi:hypothetical protein